ncbi:sugar ABC transporter substrate-binding protein [Bosea sp. AAP35]|uniref:ABC transporter substrate-binding protein n=1 Tax=Bosea sp. AAP35 TaxID=1523417 RepID=UPI0006B88A1A|nr:ABC transporter substrate-binding protein [Bosea sp. AAP35]KPF71361.1 sugar ABC transporter substrate-binding protein [Bosea sp. AAP35]
MLAKHSCRALALALAFTLPAAAQPVTEIVVQYPYGDVFKETHNRLVEEFAKTHPGIKVSFRAPYKDYEDATQRILREAVTGTTPDITFQGLNRVRALADKQVAAPLDDFIKAETDFEAQGFHKAMRDAGSIGGKVYGLPFAVSLPIAYFNLDLVKAAGGDPAALPTSWDGVISLAAKIQGLRPGVHGIAAEWPISGNWLFQALVFENGGNMMDAGETKVAFDDEAGRKAIGTLARLVTETKTPNISGNDMRTAFAAGQVGVLLTTTAYVNAFTRQIGDRFTMKTSLFPGLTQGLSRLPAGGNVMMITAASAEKRKAAWEVVKYWTGPRGGAAMVETTGYMAPNAKAADHLADFYKRNPNQYTALAQLPYLTNWYAFPGDNGLKITDVIKDHLQSVMDGKRTAQANEVLTEMARDTQALLPAGK